MVKRLISSLRKRIAWKSAAKAVLAAAALGFLALAGFFFWPIAVFIVAVSFVYFSEPPERKDLRSSFWLSAFLGFFGLNASLVSANPAFGGWIPALIVIGFGLFAFFILGTVNSEFRDRSLSYDTLNSALAAAFFIFAFFLAPRTGDETGLSAIYWFFGVFFGVAILAREAGFFGETARVKNLKLAIWSFSFLAAETASLALFLPLGFVNAAAFMTLFYILGRDVFLAHFKGHLNLSLVFRELTVFAVVLSLIFATVRWILP